jgi:hypothetical protein
MDLDLVHFIKVTYGVIGLCYICLLIHDITSNSTNNIDCWIELGIVSYSLELWGTQIVFLNFKIEIQIQKLHNIKVKSLILFWEWPYSIKPSQLCEQLNLEWYEHMI